MDFTPTSTLVIRPGIHLRRRTLNRSRAASLTLHDA
jgi:hypothetical protein